MKQMMVLLLLLAWGPPLVAQRYSPGSQDSILRRDNPYQDRNSLKLSKAERNYQLAFHRIHDNARKLARQWGEEHEPIVESLNSIYENSSFLEERWKAWLGRKDYLKEVQDPYLQGLILNGDALKGLVRNKNEDHAMEVLKAVADDMKVKADNCRNSKDGLGRTLEVVIHTRDGTEAAPGYEVHYAPLAWKDVPKRHERFLRLSSPSTRILAPGMYAFWVKKDGLEGEKQSLTIGGQGRDRLEVDLAVP